MIADRIMDYAGTGGKLIDGLNAAVLAEKVVHSVRRNFGPREERRVRMPSPSSAWGCPRRIFFDAQEGIETAPMTWRSYMAFTYGDFGEQIGVLLGRLAGIQWVSPDEFGEQAELTVEYEGRKLTGHMDASLIVEPHGECVVDFKAYADYGYGKLLKGAEKPDAEWWDDERNGVIAQLRLYMMMLRMLGRGDGQYGYVVGVNKNTGHMCEVRIERDDAEEARLLGLLSAAHQDIEAGTVPAYPDWISVRKKTAKLASGERGKCLEVQTKGTRHGWRCSYCPYVVPTCWTGYQKVVLSDGPRFRKPV